MRRIETIRFDGSEPKRRDDVVAIEEPLEIRIAGEPLAVTMRTPGSDFELVAGFLFAEGLISSKDDLGGLAHCGRPGEGRQNVVEVTAAPGRIIDDQREAAARRSSTTTTACGVCGRRSVDDLVARVGPVRDATSFRWDVLASLPERMRQEQPGFDVTGGLHAAALATADGALRCVREDVGRHNAVDKIVGRLLLDGHLPANGQVLVISGRASFEMIQKAATAKIPAVVSVSAPSSLAIDLARKAEIILVGFARGTSFNAYSGAERIR